MMGMNRNLKSETLRFIELNGFKELTEVQKEVLNYTISRKDIVALSKTGTGKTHAYLIPIAEIINPVSNKTQVLVSLPTRELSYQVYQSALVLKEVYPDLRIFQAAGGSDSKKKINPELPPHIVIGTPGRIRALFEDGQLRVDTIQMFVVDEADMTLEYGFLEDLDVVFSRMVRHVETLCFSATFPQELDIFVRKYLENPKRIEVHDKKRDPKIKHILINCKHKSYNEKLLELLKCINPYMCLIFANSKDEADATYEYLNENGYKTLLIHGGLETRERKQALNALYSKKYTYVVASDVASRGIDIDAVSHVISLGFPKELEFYIHRAGRTGRNTQTGTVFALYKETDQNAINSLKKQGVVFLEQSIKGDRLKDVVKRTRVNRMDEELEKQIAKTLYKKNEKVKPGYKKKKKMAVEKIKRRAKREYIRGKIKEERIERYKKLQREKNQNA